MKSLSIEVKLATKIGDNSKRINVVGNNTKETEQRLLHLFTKSNEKQQSK